MSPRLFSPLVVVGVGFLALGLLTVTLWPAGSNDGYREFLAATCGATGTTLLIIAFVEARHLKNALGRSAATIVRNSSIELDRKFKESFNILQQGKDAGIEAVHPPRQFETSSVRPAISQEIARTSTLRIVGISGLDFLSQPRGARVSAGHYFGALRQRLEARGAKPLDFRALLLDPTAVAAQERNELETVEGQPARIADDIARAMEGAAFLTKKYSGERVLKFYTGAPQFWAVLTDEFVFIEQYYSAPTDRFKAALQAASQPLPADELNCTGGRVPVLQYRRRSSTYAATEAHFEALWLRDEQTTDRSPSTATAAAGAARDH